jgi:hypothetical protein
MTRRLLLVCLAVVLFTPRSAAACSCADSSLQERAEAADAIFVGKVVRLEVDEAATAEAPDWIGDVILVTLRVVATAKGQVDETVDMQTSTGCCYCDFVFSIGEQYLIYAKRDGAKLETGLCSGSKLLSDAARDLDHLGLVLPKKPS